MAFLEKFSDDEKQLLVSLPYRAGVWIGSVDETGSKTADLNESVSLRQIIDKKAAGLFESAFVHEVMSELKMRDSEWDKWQGEISDIEADCSKAVNVLSTKMSDRDAQAYKQNVMQIATAVALAFREFDYKAGFFKKLARCTRVAIDRVLGGVKGEKYASTDLLNISLAEDMALSKLAKALDYNKGLEIPEK